MTKDEAYRAARRIRRFWAELGFTICADVIRHPSGTHEASTWGVKTDLKNGLPPGAPPDLWKRISKKAVAP